MNSWVYIPWQYSEGGFGILQFCPMIVWSLKIGTGEGGWAGYWIGSLGWEARWNSHGQFKYKVLFGCGTVAQAPVVGRQLGRWPEA